MTLDELKEQSKKDTEVNPNEIGLTSLETAKLQQKYINMLLEEESRKESFDFFYKRLYAEKYKYYKVDYQLSLNRQEIQEFIQGDEDIQKIQSKISMSKIKIDWLQKTIENLKQRSFHIKNYIDFTRFMNGD